MIRQSNRPPAAPRTKAAETGEIVSAHGRPVGEETRLADIRAECMRLRRDGKSYRKIAAALGIDPHTAWDHVQAELRDIRERTREDTDAVRDIEIQRIDEAMDALGSGIRAGDVPSVMAMVKLQERRAKLLGLDAPTKVERTERHIVTPEEVAKMDDRDILGVLRPMLEMLRSSIPANRFDTHDVIDAEAEATDAVLLQVGAGDS